MTDARGHQRTTRDFLRRNGQQGLRAGDVDGWSFVYVFFSNGTPFDAPNRSETCPRS